MAAAEPIRALYTELGMGMPPTYHIPEDGSETFLNGVPVFLDGDGMANEVTDGFSGTEIIEGISLTKAHNLTTQNTAESGNEHGSPQNQSSAVTTAVGSPIKTGLLPINKCRNIVFRAALVDTQTYSAALKSGTIRYELSKTANGYWAVDSGDSGTGADHVVHIIGPDEDNNEFVKIKFFIDKTAA